MNASREHWFSLAMPALTAVLVCLCALAVTRAAVVAGLHVSFDPNEGWNAYHARAAMMGTPLYPSAQDFIVNNYPPLSFYIVGVLGKLTADNVLAGRILSLLSFAAIEVLTVVAAMRLGGRRGEALFGAVLLALYLLFGTDYVGMNDPQLLGHAIELSGFVILLGDPADRRRVIGAALLCVAACFIKHNLVALPLAMAIWLAAVNRRSALTFVAAGAIFGLIGLGGFRLATGSNLLEQLNSARAWSFSNIIVAMPAWLSWAGAPAFALATGIAIWRDDPFLRFAALYALLGTTIGLLLLGGAGVDANALFDADIALSLGAARITEHLGRRDLRLPAAASALLVMPFALTIGSTASRDWLDPDYWLLSDDAMAAKADIALIAARPGPALCETLAFCYWAGKEAGVDVFNMGEAFATGSRSDAALRTLIENRHYATIEFESLAPFPLTPGIRSALERNYRLEHQDDEGVFFVPRP